MAQQERALAAKPKDFSSIPGTSLGGKREPIPCRPDPYVCTVASPHWHSCTQNEWVWQSSGVARTASAAVILECSSLQSMSCAHYQNIYILYKELLLSSSVIDGLFLKLMYVVSLSDSTPLSSTSVSEQQ